MRIGRTQLRAVVMCVRVVMLRPWSMGVNNRATFVGRKSELFFQPVGDLARARLTFQIGEDEGALTAHP